MARGSAVRNRSESVTVVTPRGPVEVVRQQVRGLRRNRGCEAVRRAILLPARKLPAWLREAADTAEAQVLADNPPAADGAS